MNNRLPSVKFFFSVEGETERWYLTRLQRLLEENVKIRRVKIDCRTEKDPLARVRGMTILSKTEIVHMFDMESSREADIQRFEAVLSKMKKAERLGKSVKYILGYSNLSFELWIILHKAAVPDTFPISTGTTERILKVSKNIKKKRNSGECWRN